MFLQSQSIRRFPLSSWVQMNIGSVRRISQAVEELKFIPEFCAGLKQHSEGEWKKSLPNFYRANEIILNTLGPSSDLTAAISLKIAQSHRYLGEYDHAVKQLQINQFSPLFQIRGLHEIALCHFYRGSAEGSHDAAKKAVNICESMKDPDYELFSPSYSLQGLSLLFQGKYSAAEEFLQMSARWADHPTAQIIGLVNLGYLSQSQSMSMIPFIPTFPTKASLSNSRESRLKVILVQEAVDYWQEGIDLSLKHFHRSSSGTTAASAMCGPIGSDFSPAGPGMDVTTIPASSSPITTPSDSIDKKLEEDIDFAIAYSGALCNIAEGSIALAENDRAADCLSSALKALHSHQSNNSKASPTLARCLMLMGCSHLHAAEAVTAEGLFRNSLDRLQSSPYGLVDPRHRLETVRALQSYGNLLKKWDKREKTGEEMIAKGNAILHQLPVYFNDMRLSQMMQIPIG